MLFTDDELLESGEGCLSCKLYRRCKSPRMSPVGKGKKKILLVSDVPGEEDDEKNEPLSGERGSFLKDVLSDLGIDMNRDCRRMNSIACRPPKGREPSEKELLCCRSSVWREIGHFKPKVVLLFGESALKSVIGLRWKKKLDGINKWRGFVIPDEKVDGWIAPSYSITHLLRNEKDQVLHLIFSKDIERALFHLDKPLPKDVGQIPSVKILNEAEGRQYINRLLKEKKLTAFDYETTGLKPYEKGHKIFSVSFCTDGRIGYAMKMTKGIKEPMRAFLADRSIPKIAANMKFESTWSTICLGVEPQGWVWDTMLYAHVEDNRSGITSLKFQTYLKFGVPDYDSAIEPFLKSDKASFNRIEECPESLLLEYNGADAVFEYRLAVLQQRSRANGFV